VPLLQLTIAAYLVPVAFGQLMIGAFADRYGRRLVLTAGMLLFLVGTAICVGATQVGWFFAGRVLQGAGAGAGLVVSRAVARDLFEGPALLRAVSTIAIAFAMVPGVAPLFGGIVQDLFGWRATFILTLALGLLALFGYRRAVAETLAVGGERSWRALLQGYGTIFRDRSFQRSAIISAGGVAGIFAFLAGGPVFAIAEQGVPASVFGFFPPLATTGFLICNRFASRRMTSHGEGKILSLGLTLLLVGSLIAALLRAFGLLEIMGLTLCMWLFSGGMGIVVPLSTSAAMQLYPARAGSAAAVIGFEQMLGGMIGAAGVAALTPIAGSLSFPLVMSAVSGGAALVFLSTGQRRVS
jgi:DHA1 family bicyclomycin/chloramphenicol resistance-like MFS transporter